MADYVPVLRPLSNDILYQNMENLNRCLLCLSACIQADT